MTMTQDEIQAVARALAKAERLDWDEVCPLEHDDSAECNSSTCIAAHDEDHDPEWARKVMLIKSQAAIAALDAARGDPVAQVAEWLRNASIWLNGGECCGQKCSDGVCCAPACIWGDELKLLHSVADAIERGEPFNA